jgi:hypothetical protein
MAEKNHVVAGTGEGLRQASRDLRVVLANHRVGPAGCHVMREQPTVVGMVVDDEKLEQRP